MYGRVVIQAARSTYPLLSANISGPKADAIYTHPYLLEGQLSSRHLDASNILSYQAISTLIVVCLK